MKHCNSTPLRRQGGFNLIELMIVIAIIAGLIIGVLAYKASAKGDTTLNAEIQNAQAIMNKLQRMKGSASTYGPSGTDLIAILVANGDYPTGMTTSGSSLSNAWGGAVTAKSNGVGMYFSEAGIPKNACADFANAFAGDRNQTVQINGGTAISGAIDVKTASDACSADPSTVQVNLKL